MIDGKEMDLSWQAVVGEESMTKCFLADGINQSLLMPPSLHDWLPENHLARFVADLVETLDMSAFYASYEEKDGRGQAAYHPVMMVRLLVYGYCIGVVSSRQIEKRTYEAASQDADGYRRRRRRPRSQCR